MSAPAQDTAAGARADARSGTRDEARGESRGEPRREPRGASHGAMRRLARTAAALITARAEFASVELGLVRAQLVRWLLLALLALLLGLLGLITLTALVAMMLWPLIGSAALLLPALAYLAGAGWVMHRLMREVDDAPPLLSETLQELARDREALLDAVAGDDGPATRTRAGESP